MFLIRGLVFTHEAVRDWEAKLAPLLIEGLRKRRAGKAGGCWHVDETYLKIAGEWCYLYRAIDRDGNLVDVYLRWPPKLRQVAMRELRAIAFQIWISNLSEDFGEECVLPSGPLDLDAQGAL